MEYKKKKNGADRNRFRLIATVLGLVLIFGILLLVSAIIDNRANQAFSGAETSLAPLPGNPVVATLLALTEMAATEQFIMTSTALP